MLLAAWLGLAEAAVFLNLDFAGMNTRELGLIANPIRVVVAASKPTIVSSWAKEVVPFLVMAAVITGGLCSLAILRVRRWNPSRDVRRGQTNETETAQAGIDVFTGKLSDEDKDQGAAIVAQSEGLRAGHVDDRSRVQQQRSRRVWDNPILWREAVTWAYGRKILFIRGAYWLLAACAVSYTHLTLPTTPYV